MRIFNKNKKIIYPLKANWFEKKVLDLFSTKIINFENLYLNNKNILVNKFIKKSIKHNLFYAKKNKKIS